MYPVSFVCRTPLLAVEFLPSANASMVISRSEWKIPFIITLQTPDIQTINVNHAGKKGAEISRQIAKSFNMSANNLHLLASQSKLDL